MLHVYLYLLAEFDLQYSMCAMAALIKYLEVSIKSCVEFHTAWVREL